MEFSVNRKYNSEVKSYTELKNRPITLENLFEKEQQQIIKSFKCPDLNFVYTPPKKEVIAKPVTSAETKPVAEKVKQSEKTKIETNANRNQILKSEVKQDQEPFKYKSYDDPATGIKFVYPESYRIINGPIMNDNGVQKLMFWYVYNYSIDGSEKELKSIVEGFGVAMGASDGPSGGSRGVGVYLDTVLSKSQDDVMIFELIRKYTIDSIRGEEIMGYILAVPTKKKSTDKYSVLINTAY